MPRMLHPAHAHRRSPVLATQTLTIGKPEMLCLLFTLLIEVGTSYWVSVATLTSVFMVVRFQKVFAKGLSGVPAFIFVLPLMYTPLLWESSIDPNQDILKITREVAFYTLEVSFFIGAKHFRFEVDQKAIRNTIRIIAIFLFCLCAIQTLTIARNVYFGIPVELFAQGENTVPDELTLRFMHVRPAATFTEPSYLAFEVLGLLTFNGFFNHLGGKDPFANILLLCSGLMSQSLSFVMFLAILMAIAVFTEQAFARYRITFVVLGMIGALGVAAASDDFFLTQRLSTAGSANGDFSIFVRIFGPAGIMGDFLASYPVGALSTAMLDAMTPFSAKAGMPPNEYLMNSIYNSFFYYGIFGGFIIYFFFNPLNKIFMSFALLSFIFNGSCFAPDKFTCYALFYLLYLGNSYGGESLVQNAKLPLQRLRRPSAKKAPNFLENSFFSNR
jgi:hypothetical protein